ncbi:hypothetical protein DBR47_21955 [Paucibacter sp. KBW04]|nr:hypothetical protein DBR47_21955 [Paucibacter sp. KBW04]
MLCISGLAVTKPAAQSGEGFEAPLGAEHVAIFQLEAEGVAEVDLKVLEQLLAQAFKRKSA